MRFKKGDRVRVWIPFPLWGNPRWMTGTIEGHRWDSDAQVTAYGVDFDGPGGTRVDEDSRGVRLLSAVEQLGELVSREVRHEGPL